MLKVGIFLRARAENVAVAVLAAIFFTFLLQIFARYVLKTPLGWTIEACLMLWLWLVFWSSAFVLRDEDHIKFDAIIISVSRRKQRVLSLVSAVAIVVGLVAALPATFDYITFYKIKKSSILRIRLDYVFSIYGVFAVAVVCYYGYRIVSILQGRNLQEATTHEADPPKVT